MGLLAKALFCLTCIGFVSADEIDFELDQEELFNTLNSILGSLTSTLFDIEAFDPNKELEAQPSNEISFILKFRFLHEFDLTI